MMQIGDLLDLKNSDCFVVLNVSEFTVTFLVVEVNFELDTIKEIYHLTKLVGIVKDSEDFLKYISSTIKDIEKKNNVKIKNLIPYMDSKYVYFDRFHEEITFQKETKITYKNIKSLTVKAIEDQISLRENAIVLDVMINNYLIDNFLATSNPLQLHAKKISSDLGVISTNKSIIDKVTRDFSEYGFNIIDCVPDIVAIATQLPISDGTTLLIDIKWHSSSFALVSRGDILQIGSFPLGECNIVSAIVRRFKVSHFEARKMKLMFGEVRKDDVFVGKKVQYSNSIHQNSIIDQEKGITKSSLSEVIRQNLRPIFATLKSKINNFQKVGSVVVAGESAKISGICLIAEDILEVHAETMSYPHSDSNPDDSIDNKYFLSCCFGSIKYIMKKRKRYKIFNGIKEGWKILNELTCFLDTIL